VNQRSLTLARCILFFFFFFSLLLLLWMTNRRMEECLKLFLNAQNVWSTRVTKEVDELGVSLHEIIALEPVIVRILQQVVRFSDADVCLCL
jgi:hypothetical protein